MTARRPDIVEFHRSTRPRRLVLTGAAGAGKTGVALELLLALIDVRAADLPHLHSFCNSLEIDRAAMNAAPTVPWHNGRTEGANTRTKRIMRQMHGRASLGLLRHRILLQ